MFTCSTRFSHKLATLLYFYVFISVCTQVERNTYILTQRKKPNLYGEGLRLFYV